MGDFTLTMDASHKVKGGSGHAVNWAKHIARDVDRENGVEARHSNRRIVPERTPMNTSFVFDEGGELALCTDSGQIVEAMHERLAEVKKPLRKDAVIMRPLVLQLDPTWFDEHNPDWREQGLNREALDLHTAMIEWAQQKFGKENIVGGSLHLDEHTPGLQLAFVPVTDDGRLSQKDWFTGPKSLSMMHTEFRTFMEERGYDVMHERSERSREHLTSDGFAHAVDVAERGQRQLDAQRAAFNAEYVESMAQLKESEAKLDAGRRELDTELEKLPDLRRQAKDDGLRDARIEARAEIEREMSTARETAAEYLRRAKKMAEEAEEDRDAARKSLRSQVAKERHAGDMWNEALAAQQDIGGVDAALDVMMTAVEQSGATPAVVQHLQRAKESARVLGRRRRATVETRAAEAYQRTHGTPTSDPTSPGSTKPTTDHDGRLQHP